MTYKLVIFDFDGTLADSFGWFLDVFDSVADRFGYNRLDRSDLEALRRMNTRQLLARHEVPLWKLPFIAAHARRLQGRHLEAIRPFPGVPALLTAIHARGIRIAVVSSNSRDNIVRVLGAETSACIDQFACGTGLSGKASRFRRVMKATGMTSAETLAIGDEVRDIEAARTVGCHAGAVSWGYAAPDRLMAEGPDHMFTALANISALLDK